MTNTDSNTPLVTERERIAFSGITQAHDTTIPEEVAEERDFDTNPDECLRSIIKKLPNAAVQSIDAHNEFANEDGTVDLEGIEEALSGDTVTGSVHDLNRDLDGIDDADDRVHVHDHQLIVDKRREALNALGYSCKYWWQVAKSYTVINPSTGYNGLARFLTNKEPGSSVFGWVDIDDFGGAIDIYIFFCRDDMVLEITHDERDTASSNTTDDSGTGGDEDSGQDPDRIIYMGIKSGYDFSGGRAFDSELFGLDITDGIWLFGLSERNSRQHRGAISDIKDEIKDWWEREFDRIISSTDEFIEVIRDSEKHVIDFTTAPFTVTEFYSMLGYPTNDQQNGYADIAAKRLRTQQESLTAVSVWSLAYTALNVLEEEFESNEGDKHTSAHFRAHVDEAIKLLHNPRERTKQAFSDYKRKTQPDFGVSDQLTFGDVEYASRAGEESLVEKRNTVAEIQQEFSDIISVEEGSPTIDADD